MANYVMNAGNSTEQINNNSPPRVKSIIDKLKQSGYKPIVLIMILLVVAVIMFNFSSDTKKDNVVEDVDSTNYSTSLQYVEKIEKKLNSVISNIKGAGKVEVMISINSSPELSILENVEEKVVSTSSGTTTTTTTQPIIVEIDGEDSPLILKETLPSINGVIVVSSGASDIRVKLDIITAVSTALGINSNKVEVFVGV